VGGKNIYTSGRGERALRTLGDLGLDGLYNSGLRERAQVTELVTLARDDFAHDAAHDLQGRWSAHSFYTQDEDVGKMEWEEGRGHTLPERVLGRCGTM